MGVVLLIGSPVGTSRGATIAPGAQFFFPLYPQGLPPWDCLAD